MHKQQDLQLKDFGKNKAEETRITDMEKSLFRGEIEPLVGQSGKLPQVVTISETTANGTPEAPPPYPGTPPHFERIPQPDDDDHLKTVHFQRSQSLPHLSVDNLRRGGPAASRVRYFSGRASQATLVRMRHISQQRFASIAPTDENQARGNWSNPIEFFLSCLGYAVGLGNVWRFPYLCYRNGGGAFLIPYFIMLFTCGLPLMLLELTLGQYSSEGPLTVWKVAPLFKGLGIGMVVCSCMVAVYYNVITGWALYYIVLSLREVLPWTCCAGQWATEHCVSFVSNSSLCQSLAPIDENSTIIDTSSLWKNGSKAKFAADEFFHNHVLGLSGSLEKLGNIQWPIFLALVFAWIIVFLVLMKGIKSFGKAVYFTSTFPYLVLLILLVRAVMEPGAINGIKFYLTPRWEKLAEASVWGDAASQIFYSTGVCFGGAITLASYNRFRNNLYRDAIIVTLGNSATSIFSGFVVFSILGFMAEHQNTTVDKVATEGPGLTFIAYPQAVTLLPISPLWSIMFFVMLVTLALSTMFPTVENIGTAILDQFPQLRAYKFFVMGGICLTALLCGLPLCTEGGVYILQLMDSYGVGYALLILGLIEVTVIAWRYKASRLLKNIAAMVGFTPTVLWKYMWTAITPTILTFSIFFNLVNSKLLKYGTYTYPEWTMSVGFLLTSVSLLPVPIYAVVKFIRHMRSNQCSVRDVLTVLTIPTQEWGPSLPQYKVAGVDYDEDDVFS